MANCKLQELLREDAEKYIEVLQKPPYNLTVQNTHKYYLFKYNQIKSDFSEKVVREARGIIFDSDDWSICCRPFEKFFNWGETYVDEIDWSSAIITEKLDGSLIKIWRHNGEIGVSTNRTIDASQASLPMPFVNNAGFEINSFFSLVFYTMSKMLIHHYQLLGTIGYIEDEETALFELCTPYNRIVVPYTDCKLYYLGSRDNETGEEFQNKGLGDLFPTPKTFKTDSLDDLIKLAEKLPYDQEGYVVKDVNNHRIKVKSSAYIAIHHMKGEGVVSKKRMLDLIRLGEHEEFLNYFPEYEDTYWKVNSSWVDFNNKLFVDAEEYRDKYKDVDRKTLALWATKECAVPAFIFCMADGKINSVKEFLFEQSSEKLLKWMGQ